VRRRKKDPLRELLDRQLSAFCAKAGHKDASISSDEMESIAHLARLIALRDSMRPKRRNWPAAIVLAGTLAIVSVLLFARIGETEIELDVSASGAAFAVPHEQAVSGAMDLASLGMSGAQPVELPFPGAGSEQAALSLTRASAGGRQGSVTLSPIVLPAGGRIALRRSDVANQYELLAGSPGLNIQVAVYGPVRVALAGTAARDVDFPIPRPVALRAGSEDAALSLTFPALPQSPLSPQLAVSDLDLSRIDRFDAAGALVKRLSTIISGTLFYESLNGEQLKLRAGEELQFEKSSGEIRALQLAADHLGLQFHGRVRGMTTGDGEGHRSLMPTYLEWLHARRPMALLWATSLYLAALATAALRWWGVHI
jgi:hypothetical protein